MIDRPPMNRPLSFRQSRPEVFQRIASLLWVVVVALMIVFCYVASAFCITLVLATFLSISVDPLVSFLERFRIPRTVSSALLIIAGMATLGYLAYGSYRRLSDFVEAAPSYASRLRDMVEPISHKIARVEESAGRLNPEEQPPHSKKIAEVKVQQAPTWPSYLVRGLGSVSSTVVILGVVPFLMYFMLIRKEKWYQTMAQALGPKNDPLEFSASLALMVRRFTLSNFIVGLLLGGVSTCVLLALKIQGALVLGLISGVLNLIPFLGVVLATLLPAGAALLQWAPIGSVIIICITTICLHIASANFLVPRFIGSRMNVGPVAATAGILFWGWLWGIVGVLLAIPLTGTVKLIADCHPSLKPISNILSDSVLTRETAIATKQDDPTLSALASRHAAE